MIEKSDPQKCLNTLKKWSNKVINHIAKVIEKPDRKKWSEKLIVHHFAKVIDLFAKVIEKLIEKSDRKKWSTKVLEHIEKVSEQGDKPHRKSDGKNEKMIKKTDCSPLCKSDWKNWLHTCEKVIGHLAKVTEKTDCPHDKSDWAHCKSDPKTDRKKWLDTLQKWWKNGTDKLSDHITKVIEKTDRKKWSKIMIHHFAKVSTKMMHESVRTHRKNHCKKWSVTWQQWSNKLIENSDCKTCYNTFKKWCKNVKWLSTWQKW